ncbi:hypothetical protein F0562_020788 [Nyssa sinensis]|uniref:MATH domain-containing protein n=1 Tax=Nyssa sinensis TaxID=561372 RepID=A0A5J5BWR8_9ASTE|nr:hypothetical protein F0562_020788 [Nyssa sinensis]
MAKNSCRAIVPFENNDIDGEVSRSLRAVRPAHYLLNIQSFSTFYETDIENYETGDFEAGGYKWKLCLYPNGNKKRNVNDHISLYLVISDTKNLPHGWEVNIQFKFFVFDHIKDKYLTVQDGGGRVRRFHAIKTEWGFDQFLSLDTFKNVSNGYLCDDSCILGAEVFVIHYAGEGECLSLIKAPAGNIYTWKVHNFSALSKEELSSEEFKTGKGKWYDFFFVFLEFCCSQLKSIIYVASRNELRTLTLYPKGTASVEGESLSLFLSIADSATLPLNRKIYAKYKLRIRDQLNNKHKEREGENHISLLF